VSAVLFRVTQFRCQSLFAIQHRVNKLMPCVEEGNGTPCAPIVALGSGHGCSMMPSCITKMFSCRAHPGSLEIFVEDNGGQHRDVVCV
jgi:hypothetical protein